MTIPTNVSAKIYWSKGKTRVHKGLEINRPIQNAKLSKVQLRSAEGQALISSGCYACSFSDIVIGRSRRLLGVQGSRNSIYENISGEFYERGIEVTMFANGNTIRAVDGRYLPLSNYEPRPAIRVGEYARNNLIEDVTLKLIDDARLLRIRFNHSSSNQLQNINMHLDQTDFSRNADRLLKSMDDLPRKTTIDNFRVCVNKRLLKKNNCLGHNLK